MTGKHNSNRLLLGDEDGPSRFPFTPSNECVYSEKSGRLILQNQRLALIVNSHNHYRMWYLTDQSTPAGLSLCLGCGCLATGPSSYRNGMGRGGSAQSQGGAGTASILLLPYHLHHGAAAVCLSTQRHHNNVCGMYCNEPVSLIRSMDSNYEVIHLSLQ